MATLSSDAKPSKKHIRPQKIDSFLQIEEGEGEGLILLHPISRKNTCSAGRSVIVDFFQNYFRESEEAEKIPVNIKKEDLEITCTVCEREKQDASEKSNNPTIGRRNTLIKVCEVMKRLPKSDQDQINEVIKWRKNVNLRNNEIKNNNAIECPKCLNQTGLNGLAYQNKNVFMSIYENNEASNIYVCNRCSTPICKNCKHIYQHRDNFRNIDLQKDGAVVLHNHLSCDDIINMKEKDPNEILIKMTTQKCPNCPTLIEKNDGCNHMTCKQCKHEFCFICLKKWYCSEH